jgi:two-component system, OmpR family, sensor histidine kinase KdpD
MLEAQDVVLVDLTPEALQARLRAGRIYPIDRVDSALLNFFTSANLNALREVALREVAGAVDEQLHRDAPPMRPELGGPPAPHLEERVMVLARPEVGAQRLVRGAWRAARRLGAELDVVVPEGRSDEEAARQRRLLREIAVTLGAHVIEVPDDELAERLARLARERGVTRLVLAAPRGRSRLSRLRGDLVSDLLERLDDVDLFLIADRERGRVREDGR